MDIHEQVASEAEKAALELGKTAVKTSRELAETSVGIANGIISLINALRLLIKNKRVDLEMGEKTLDKIEELVTKGDYLSELKVPDKDIGFFKKSMQKEGMVYAVLDENINAHKKIIFMHSDTKKMENIISLCHAKAGLIHEIEPDLFIRHCKAKNIGMVHDISDTDFELFRHKARETELVYSFYEKDGRITLLYNPKDKDIIGGTLDEVALDMSGKHSKCIINDMTLRHSMNRDFENALAGRGEFYAVNARNNSNYITITAAGLAYYKNNSIVAHIDRSDKFFADKARDTFKGLQNSVNLSRHEFELSDEKRNLIIKSRGDIYDEIASKDIEKSRERLRNVIHKMSLDDENDNPSQVFDDAVSYSNYAGYEELSDIDREEMKEQFEKFYNKRKTYNYKEIPVKNRSLDNIIQNAEKQKDNSNSKDIPHRENNHEYESEKSL